MPKFPDQHAVWICVQQPAVAVVPSDRSPTSMGTIGKDTVDNTIIEVDGNILGFQPGTRFNK